MGKLSIVSLIALMGFATVWSQQRKENNEPWPDLSNAKKLAEVLKLAMPAERIPVSTKDGERLLHLPDRQTLYEGWSKKMHANGKIDDLIHYKDGKQNGPWNRWYENGQRQYDFMMKDGKMITGTGWKPTGEPSPTKIVNGNGLCVGYHVNGRKRFEGRRVNGDLEGIVSFWYANGVKYWQRNFKRGKANGPAKEWVSSTNPSIITGRGEIIPTNPTKLRKHNGIYTNGLRNGEWIEWDENGLPSIRRTYKAGVIVNTTTGYAD
ncbi:MAG: hypothetical protein VCA18_13230 [Opitutales bacterium]